MRRVANHLVPVNEMASDDLTLVPADQDVFVTVRSRRSPAQHRMAWALAQKLAEACDFLHDREEAMEYLKMKCRHVRWVIEPARGRRPERTYMMPKSIAWASLTQERFSRLFNRMIFVVCSDVLPDLKESDLRKEIEAMCVGDTKRRKAA